MSFLFSTHYNDISQEHKNIYYVLRFNILTGSTKQRSEKMRATTIFLAFFLIFTAASIAVPIPLFPGNTVTTLSLIPTSDFTTYLEALTNGLTYGFIIWIMFFWVDKKIEKATSIETEQKP